MFAGAFLLIEILFVALDLDERSIDAFLRLILFAGGIYWLACVYKIHKILEELTRGRYPFSPIGAALRHFVPFYNIYWLFKWPLELSDYVSRKGRVKMISGAVIGLLLLLSMLLRLVDGAIGLAVTFGVTMYVANKLKAHVKSMHGVTPDQLPPLPDPRIFSRPLETATSPAQAVVEDSRAG
ncbi:MAG TPA: hypothetical protein VFY60_04805 [Pyrinomonadaceae bacterium]|nr:hypothetical protein [Pyrinomonadaceae bacterium]